MQIHSVSTETHLSCILFPSRNDLLLTMAAHVGSVCRSAYYQLQQLCPVMRSLSLDAAKVLAQAFVSSCLDYCNSTLYGITDSLFRRLQSVQTATARLITGVQCKDHITPILQQLNWLPVRERVIFKFKHALLVFKALHAVCCRRISRTTVSC